MGGHAYLIPGSVDPRLWQNAPLSTLAPASRSLWSRLTGAARSGGSSNLPRVTTLPNGDRLFELNADPLPDRLIPDFLNWARARLVPPSRASAVALEYLQEIKSTLYVRGKQRPADSRPAFYVQMTFSGCAGMAETSARVASHWTSLWFRTDHDRLTREYLAPYGFHPDPYDPAQDEPLLFLPLGKFGYAEYIPPDNSTSQPMVELDQSVVESRPDELDFERLTEVVGRQMTARRCRCQLCEPGVEDVSFD